MSMTLNEVNPTSLDRDKPLRARPLAIKRFYGLMARRQIISEHRTIQFSVCPQHANWRSLDPGLQDRTLHRPYDLEQPVFVQRAEGGDTMSREGVEFTAI
jgi:hypothetical protein